MTMQAHADDVLVLKPSRLRSLLIAVGCAIAVRGIWEVRHEAGGAAAWVGLAAFGFGAVLGTVRLLPGASYLRLDAHGFTWCAMFRRGTIAWADVSEFGVLKGDATHAYRTVGFNFVPGYRANAQGRELAKQVSGWEGALPGKYGLRAADLADLMNEWRQRHGAG